MDRKVKERISTPVKLYQTFMWHAVNRPNSSETWALDNRLNNLYSWHVEWQKARGKTCLWKSEHLYGLMIIDVGQWLVAGLQWSSSVRQSLAVRQKELSEWYRLILKRQKCIEIKLNPCNFLLFFTSFCSFFYFSFLFLYFLSFFAIFLYFSASVYTTEVLHDKMGLQLKAMKARALRRCVCACLYVSACIYMCGMCVYICVCVRVVCVCIYIYVCVCIYVCIYIYIK